MGFIPFGVLADEPLGVKKVGDQDSTDLGKYCYLHTQAPPGPPLDDKKRGAGGEAARDRKGLDWMKAYGIPRPSPNQSDLRPELKDLLLTRGASGNLKQYALCEVCGCAPSDLEVYSEIFGRGCIKTKAKFLVTSCDVPCHVSETLAWFGKVGFLPLSPRFRQGYAATLGASAEGVFLIGLEADGMETILKVFEMPNPDVDGGHAAKSLDEIDWDRERKLVSRVMIGTREDRCFWNELSSTGSGNFLTVTAYSSVDDCLPVVKMFNVRKREWVALEVGGDAR